MSNPKSSGGATTPRTWLARLIGPGRRPATRRAFRPVLLASLDGLEDRLAPAVAGQLSLVNGSIAFSGNQLSNNLTITNAAASITISDLGINQITVSSPLVAAGVTGNGTSSVVIPNAALLGISGLSINTGSGADLVTFAAAFTRNLDLSVTSPLINLFSGATAIDTGTGFAVGKNVSLQGTVIVNAADSTINTKPAGALSGNININGIAVGSGSLTLTTASGTAGTGNIVLSGPTALSGTADFLATGNNISTGYVQTATTGNITLSGLNSVTTTTGLRAVTSGNIAISANQDGVGSQGFTQGGQAISNNGNLPGDIRTTSGTVAVTVNVNGTGGTGNLSLRNLSASTTLTLEARGAAAAGGSISQVPFVNSTLVTAGTSSSTYTGSDYLVTATTSITAQAATGISLNSQTAAFLQANTTNTTTGSNNPVKITNNFQAAGALTVQTSTTAQGSITIENNGALTVSTGSGVIAVGTGQTVSLTTRGNGNIVVTAVPVTANGTNAAPIQRDLTNAVTLTAGGTGTINATGTITGGTITLTGGAGVGTGATLPIEAQTSTGTGPTTGPGRLYVSGGTGLVDVTDQSGGLTVKSASSAGSSVTVVASDTTATAAVALEVSGTVSASTNVTLTSSGGNFSNLYFSSGTVQSTGGAIAMTARADLLTSPGTQVIGGTSTTVLTAGSGFTGTTYTLGVNGFVSGTNAAAAMLAAAGTAATPATVTTTGLLANLSGPATNVVISHTSTTASTVFLLAPSLYNPIVISSPGAGALAILVVDPLAIAAGYTNNGAGLVTFASPAGYQSLTYTPARFAFVNVP